jgi:very-short-patch-repair endonuclease
MEAALDGGTGAVISIGAAASWWGLPGWDLRRIDVSRPRGITSTRLWVPALLHEVLDLTSDQVTVLDGIPIVRPERLAFELFAHCSYPRAERAVETAWSKGLLSSRSLELVFEQLAERGRDGTVDTRSFLETHPPEWIPPASGNEAQFAKIAREGLLGRWRRQVDLGDDRWVGRVDYLHEELPIIVEVQSERYHTALLDVAADRARRARLVDAGFSFVEVWDTEVWHDRGAVITRVRAAIREYLVAHPPVRPADRGTLR